MKRSDGDYALASAAAATHLESAQHYAALAMGDWIAVYSDGRVFFPAGEPTHPDVVMAAPLSRENAKSVKALRVALLESVKEKA